MTLIPQTQKTPVIIQQITPQEELVKKTSPIIQSVPLPKLKPEEDKTVNVAREVSTQNVNIYKQESLNKIICICQEIEEKYLKDEADKELYSDEEEEEDETDEEEVEEIVVKKPEVKETKAEPTSKPDKPAEEPPEEDEDVEIIDEEEIEEELEDEEEEEVEEEISDVDDSDLLNRLEAKYGRLPEPERPGKNSKKLSCARYITLALACAITQQQFGMTNHVSDFNGFFFVLQNLISQYNIFDRSSAGNV